MKCPKCGYLGFEPVERCRNCGYDFSLTTGVDLPEFPIREGPRRVTPLDDLSLIDAATAPQPETPMTDVSPEIDRGLRAPAPRRPAGPSGELPLFRSSVPDDEP